MRILWFQKSQLLDKSAELGATELQEFLGRKDLTTDFAETQQVIVEGN